VNAAVCQTPVRHCGFVVVPVGVDAASSRARSKLRKVGADAVLAEAVNAGLAQS